MIKIMIKIIIIIINLTANDHDPGDDDEIQVQDQEESGIIDTSHGNMSSSSMTSIWIYPKTKLISLCSR